MRVNHSVLVILLNLTLCILKIGAQTTIGGLTPDPSAILDVQGNNKGVLFPRMDNTQRGNLSMPATGLMIFNTSTRCLEINLGSTSAPSWQAIKCPPPAAVTGLNCAGTVQTGYLQPAQAASGLSLSIPYTGGNGGSFSQQTINSTGVTGLTANLSDGLIESGAGNLALTITGTGATAGVASFAINFGGQNCTVDVPVGCGAYIGVGQWKQFLCHNLGSANTTADPFAPSWEINGGYWQWGRQAEAAAGPTSPDFFDANFFIQLGWNPVPAGSSSWYDLDPMPNNPCPSGFRVPTLYHWQQVRDNSLNPQTSVGPWIDGPTEYGSGKLFGKGLFLPAAGARNQNDGDLFNRGGQGFYWSSTEENTDPFNIRAFYLKFDNASATAFPNVFDPAAGFSIRCMKE